MNLNDPTLLRTDSYVNGAWTAAPGDRRFAVTNPATGEAPKPQPPSTPLCRHRKPGPPAPPRTAPW